MTPEERRDHLATIEGLGQTPEAKAKAAATRQRNKVAATKPEPAVKKVYPGKGGVGRAHLAVTPTGLVIIKRMAAKGCILETIAAALGMSHDTLENCRRRQPEVAAALEVGRGELHDELVDILVTQARAGAFVPAIFLLKSRFGYKEGTQIDVNVDHGGVLLLPAEVTVEQYLAQRRADGDLIDVTPSERPALYPGHIPLPPQTIEHQPEEPAPRPIPTGTTIAAFPTTRTRVTRGD